MLELKLIRVSKRDHRWYNIFSLYCDFSLCHIFLQGVPDSKVHGANMGPTWVLSAPDGPHVGPMNLAIRGLLGRHSIATLKQLTLDYTAYYIK